MILHEYLITVIELSIVSIKPKVIICYIHSNETINVCTKRYIYSSNSSIITNNLLILIIIYIV